MCLINNIIETLVVKITSDATAFLKGISEVGAKLDKVGGDLTKKLTLPITGLIGGIVKIGAEFESQMSRVGAISGATGEDFKALAGKAKELGATTKFSATESAQALEYMAMSGWKTEEMLNGIDGVLNLAAASGEGLALVADIVSDSMTAFGIEASESARFADVLAGTVSNANTNVAMMGESFKYVAPLSGALGFSIEDTSLAIGLMANSGIKGSQAGTALRSTITRLVKPTDDSAKAMAELGISITDDKGDMLSLREVMDTMRGSFGDLTQAEKASNAALIAGQEGMSGLLAIVTASEADYNKLVFAIDNSTGSAKKMADEMQNNLMGKLTMIKSSLEGLALQFYDVLKPALNKVADGIQNFINFLAGLDEQSKKTILVVAGIVASIVPLLLIMGQVISLAGSLGSALVLLTGPVGLVIAGIAGLTVAGIELYKYFSQSLIPEIEHFTDGVSKTTQESTKYFLQMHEELTRDLKTLSISGQEITEKMKNGITSNVAEMAADTKIAINNAKEDSLASLKTLFDGAVSISAEEKEAIIANTAETYDAKINQIAEAEQTIAAVMELALEDKRALTAQELAIIEESQQLIAELGIKHMTDSELEQKIILEKMKDNAALITAEQSAVVVKNSIEQKNKVISEANEQCDFVIGEILRQRDEAGTLSAEQADLLIAEAQRQKNETVENAKEMHNTIVAEAKLQAGEHIKAVDWETGEILTVWDTFKGALMDKLSSIKDSLSKAWQAIKAVSMRVFDELKAFWDVWGDDITKVFNDALSALLDFFTSTFNDLFDLIKYIFNAIKDFWDIWGGIITLVFVTTFKQLAAVFEGALGVLQNLFKVFVGVFTGDWGKAWDGLKGIFKSAWDTINKLFDIYINYIKRIFEELPKTLYKYGQYVIEGFYNGINDKGKWLVDKISGFFGGVTDKIKGFFGIHSPSTLFRDEIGKNLVLGLAEGIDKNAAKAEKEAEKLAKNVFEKSKEWIDDYKESTDYLASEELKMWEILAEQYAGHAKIKKEISANIAKVQEQINQESFEHSKKWIEQRKDLGLLTAQEEIEAWERVSERYEEGSKQRAEADKQLFASQKQLFKESEDLLNKMAAAEEQYQKAVDDRATAIYNTFGLFDELKQKEEVSTETLITNLKNQVMELNSWANNVESLAKRGIDDGLLDELRKMGPSANAEIAALNRMTDAELNAYQMMWGEKHRLAKEQAIKELEGLRVATDAQIQGLMSDLTHAMSSKSNPIGVNMIQGIIDGIQSQSNALKSTMRSLMNDVVAEANTTLDIHSPSRVFAKIGNFTGLGFIDGLTGMQNKLATTVNKVFGADLLDSIPDLQAGDKMHFDLDNVKGIANDFKYAKPQDASPSNTSKTEVTINMDGLFKGANLQVREDSDIEKIARLVISKLDDYVGQKKRNTGLQEV